MIPVLHLKDIKHVLLIVYIKGMSIKASVDLIFNISFNKLDLTLEIKHDKKCGNISESPLVHVHAGTLVL